MNEDFEPPAELEESEGAVAPWLDEFSMPVARDAFRDDLRARFLAGFSDEGELVDGAPAEVEQPLELEVGEQLGRLLDLHGLPRARTRFRLVLERRFVEQREREQRARDEDVAPGPARAHSRAASAPTAKAPSAGAPRAELPRRRTPRRTPTRSAPRSRRWLTASILTAAAAVLLLFALDPFGRGGPEWWLWQGQELRHLLVDGQSLASLSPDEVVLRLRRAQHMEASGGDVRVGFGRLFALELGDGSKLRVDEMPVGAGETFRLAGTGGAFRFATGPDFQFEQQHLSFEAPDATVQIVGTVFGVDVFEDVGSCICCSEGKIEVTPHDGAGVPHLAPHRVEAERMSFVFVDRGMPPKSGSVVDQHLPALVRLAADARELWQTAR